MKVLVISPIKSTYEPKLSLREVRKDMQNPDVVMRDESIMYNAVNIGLILGLSGGVLAPEE